MPLQSPAAARAATSIENDAEHPARNTNGDPRIRPRLCTRIRPPLRWRAARSASTPPQCAPTRLASGQTAEVVEESDMSMENFVPEDPLVMRLWMKTIHSKSPLYQATRKQVSQMSGKHLGLK